MAYKPYSQCNNYTACKRFLPSHGYPRCFIFAWSRCCRLTHPLIWFLAKQDAKLSKKAFAAFKSAQEGTGTHIWVPAAVAWEISQLMRKTNRITALGSFEELIQENFFFKSMTLTELQSDDIVIAHGLNFNRDPFDSLIVATAERMELSLITAEAEITHSNTCQIFWE